MITFSMSQDESEYGPVRYASVTLDDEATWCDAVEEAIEFICKMCGYSVSQSAIRIMVESVEEASGASNDN